MDAKSVNIDVKSKQTLSRTLINGCLFSQSSYLLFRAPIKDFLSIV